ncbi:MAG: 2,3-bisphosphoglycerate-independent phosphoglycerate mutase [Candidatus Baldrarchaeia archaeon]
MKKLKVILVIADGMGDRPLKELGHKTPLEAANTPALDHIASSGVCGIMDPIAPGVRPGSDTSHLAILGYDPYKYYSGRGPFEALGAGMELKEGDIAFRANFATVQEKDNKLIVIDRRAGRKIPEGDAFTSELSKMKLESAKDVEVIVKHTVEHRCVVVLRGRNLSHHVSDTDPHEEMVPIKECKPLSQDDAALRTAKMVNELTYKSYQILNSHPLNVEREKRGLPKVNCILLRGAGVYREIPSLQRRFGIKAACIAGAALYKGVARAVGMEIIKVPGATGTYETDVIAKARAAIDALRKYDFVFIHFKATDNASHDGNIEMKIKMLEKFDVLVKYLIDNVNMDETIITVTSDHTTPISIRDHTGDPVPLAICAPDVRRDDVEKFDERSCARGHLGRIRGTDLMNILMDLANRSEKFGA